MLVTVLGPDGTGKTSLAKALAAKNKDFKYIYFGYNNESRNYRYFEGFIKSDLQNIFSKAARKFLVFVNDLYYYRLSKRKNIISDRCPIDSYIATKIRGDKLKYYYWLLSSLSPKPDYVFLLEGDASIIYNRKKEISVETIQQIIKYYKEYLQKKRIRNTQIDTTKNDLEQTIGIALGILNKLNK